MKTTFLILITLITTMTQAQEDFIQEPVLTGSMAAKIVQAAVEQAEKDGVLSPSLLLTNRDKHLPYTDIIMLECTHYALVIKKLIRLLLKNEKLPK